MQIKKETRYFRSQDGWEGETTFQLSEDRVVRIITSRSYGKLKTSASSLFDDGTGFMRFIIGSKATADYTKVWAVSKPARVTEAVLQRQHESVLAKAAEIEAEVIAYYREQAEHKAEQP